MPQFLTKKDVADLLKVSTRSIDYYREKCSLPSHILAGKLVRFVESEVLQWAGVPTSEVVPETETVEDNRRVA